MKKIYNIPQIRTSVLDTEMLIADSPNVTIGSGSVDAAEVGVKESSTASYNVWDDDWSK